MTIKDIREAIEDLPDDLPVIIKSDDSLVLYYKVIDIDNTSLALEISKGEPYSFD